MGSKLSSRPSQHGLADQQVFVAFVAGLAYEVGNLLLVRDDLSVAAISGAEYFLPTAMRMTELVVSMLLVKSKVDVPTSASYLPHFFANHPR